MPELIKLDLWKPLDIRSYEKIVIYGLLVQRWCVDNEIPGKLITGEENFYPVYHLDMYLEFPDMASAMMFKLAFDNDERKKLLLSFGFIG